MNYDLIRLFRGPTLILTAALSFHLVVTAIEPFVEDAHHHEVTKEAVHSALHIIEDEIAAQNDQQRNFKNGHFDKNQIVSAATPFSSPAKKTTKTEQDAAANP